MQYMIYRTLLVMALLVSSSDVLAATTHPGRAVYDQNCAACHDHPQESRSRPLESLQQMIPGLVEYALTDGKMQQYASGLSDEEMRDLLDFLTGQTREDNKWVAGAMCDAADRDVDTSPPPTIRTFGLGPKNHRYLSADAAGLSREDFAHLELAWAFAFPNITMMRSQPAIVGSTMFITPVDSQQLYALNLDGKPCIQWVYQSDRPLRTAITYGKRKPDDRAVLVFGDMGGRIHQVDAATGKGLWLADLKLFPETIITGTPQLVGDRIYASISQFEIMIGRHDEHECCKSHGAVAALDAATGERIWVTHTMPDARPVRDRGDGNMIWGPSGAPVWTSPAIDLKRGVLYVGTGEALRNPPTPTPTRFWPYHWTKETSAGRFRQPPTTSSWLAAGATTKH